jgi:hypothetical protein
MADNLHTKIEKGLRAGTLNGNDTVTVAMLQGLSTPEGAHSQGGTAAPTTAPAQGSTPAQSPQTPA